MKTIFTIGYEGAEQSLFLDTLIEAGISHVIDIRDVPASRRRGFSKTPLSIALDERGMSYTHLKPLGDPKPGREAMRSGDYEAFLTIYNEHIEQPAAQTSLVEAVTIATSEPSVLLCYERDPKYCHRTLVADMMKELATFTVRHLGVREKRRPALGGQHDSSAERAHALG